MFQLTSNLESAFEVRILSALAQIITTDGRTCVDPQDLGFFLGYLIDPILHSKNRFPVCTIDDGDKEEWLRVASQCEELAAEIRKIIPNNTAHSSEPG